MYILIFLFDMHICLVYFYTTKCTFELMKAQILFCMCRFAVLFVKFNKCVQQNEKQTIFLDQSPLFNLKIYTYTFCFLIKIIFIYLLYQQVFYFCKFLFLKCYAYTIPKITNLRKIIDLYVFLLLKQSLSSILYQLNVVAFNNFSEHVKSLYLTCD